MSCVICCRCGVTTDLDYDDGGVILKGTNDYCCWTCLSDEEVEEYEDQ